MKRHNRSEVAFKRYLRRFPSNSKIIQCVPEETTPCANKGSLIKKLIRNTLSDKEIFLASRNVKPFIG